MVEEQHEFDIAVSFAGEDRNYVSEVVGGVKDGVKVFYDEDYAVEAWGEDGVEYFSDVYLSRAKYAVMFVSQHYAAKMWTNVERRAALARAATQRSAYILPVRLDDTELPGLLPTVIYLDARRLGIAGLIAAIKAKLGGNPPAVLSTTVLDGKVPRSQKAIEALMTERPGVWEYLLYAGLLKANMDKLEPKYQDFTMGFAVRNGRSVARDELVDFAQSAIASISAIVRNFERVLGAEVQERAFGKPGEPGDVDRVVHLAERFVSVYEDFMDWASDLRGTATRVEGGADALRVLARWAEQPVEECRRFVAALVVDMDTVTERVEAGENVAIDLTVKLELDPTISEEFNEKLRRAFEDGDGG